ncbi:triacylglycerol lipase OBL1-like [Benincasa hispida]|uniref:triacylglycerol lipase OBL1-like n=1 Tax=Benincasa hispida TaxID=102211 RepID=UPI0018FFE291|nr:triacylglycerol lipase OBL1-like [Benincasa hispida]
MDLMESEFSKNYVILKPENANLLDLFLFLLPFGLRKRKFIDCPLGKEDPFKNFRDRWLIFISMLLQFILAIIATPLAKLDSFLLKLLNFISFNGGVSGILSKILKGKSFLEVNEDSPEYTSVVGFADWRRDLDSSIKPDDTFRYYSALTVMAAKVSYESKPFVQSVVNDRWKMKLLGYFNFWNDFQGKATTQAFMFENTAIDPNVIVVAFRGTSLLDSYDWQVDADFSWYEIEGVGRIHSGFMKALGLQKATGWPKELPKSQLQEFAYYTIRQKLRDIAKTNDKARFIITGHSLGGALATLFVTVLSLHDESTILEKLEGIYTYGQPRVGDQQFAKFMVNTVQKYGFKYHRYVYSSDLVPRLPSDAILFKYKHFGRCVFFNTLYRGRIVKEQPNKNYFSLVWVIPKYLSAWWELIRSLIIPLVKGFDYYESLLMKGGRVVGLFIPGLAAHFPLNYVNSTRLGKLNVPDKVEDPILGDDIEDDF